MILVESPNASPRRRHRMRRETPPAVRVVRIAAVCLAAVLTTLGGAQAAQSASAARANQPASQAGKAASAPKSAAATAKARQVRLARARAAAKARELAAASVPRFRLDEELGLVPDVRAEAALIYNPATGQVIWENAGFTQRSIASITKVMTALCFLDTDPDLTREVTVARADVRGASTTFLRAAERVKLQDLLHLALVASDNVAARTLARVSSDGPDAFLDRMNEKAEELGLTSTAFADPSGLDARNVSSAYDLARLIAYAAEDDLVATVMRTAEYTFRTNRRTLTIHNTNQLLRTNDLDVRGGKTGFITKSGHCLATLLRLQDLNQTVAVVVLGARSNAGRFWETRHLFNWLASKAHGLLTDGQHGPVPADGSALPHDRK